jgi:hypothetical protein
MDSKRENIPTASTDFCKRSNRDASTRDVLALVFSCSETSSWTECERDRVKSAHIDSRSISDSGIGFL